MTEKTFVKMMSGIVLMGLMVSCKGKHQGLEQDSSLASLAQSKAIEAYEQSFYKFAQDVGCVQCHSSRVTPRFVAADIATAYAEAKGLSLGSSTPYLNLDNPGASMFVDYVGNAHCGEAACSDPARKPTATQMIETWVAAEKEILAAETADSQNQQTNTNTNTNTNNNNNTTTPPPVVSGPKFYSNGLQVPATIPNLMTAGVALLRFPGNALSPAVPALQNAIIEVELKMANANEYRFSRLKVVGNSAAVTLTGVHIYVKTQGTQGPGLEDLVQGGGWSGLTLQVPVAALPNPVPTTPLNVTPLTQFSVFSAMFSTTDIVTLGFDNIQ